MQRYTILISFRSRIVLLLLLFLCPLATNAQIRPNMVNLPPVPKPLSTFSSFTRDLRLQPLEPPAKQTVPQLDRWQSFLKQTNTRPEKSIQIRQLYEELERLYPEFRKIKLSPIHPLNSSTANTELVPNSSNNTSLRHNTLLKSSISTDITNEWWVEYIRRIIEEQMILLRMDKMEKQLFKNGMQIDVEMEEDTVGFIIYDYEYRLDAA